MLTGSLVVPKEQKDKAIKVLNGLGVKRITVVPWLDKELVWVIPYRAKWADLLKTAQAVGGTALDYKEHGLAAFAHELAARGYSVAVHRRLRHMHVKASEYVVTIESDLGGYTMSSRHGGTREKCGTGLLLLRDANMYDVIDLLDNIERAMTVAYARLCPGRAAPKAGDTLENAMRFLGREQYVVL